MDAAYGGLHTAVLVREWRHCGRLYSALYRPLGGGVQNVVLFCSVFDFSLFVAVGALLVVVFVLLQARIGFTSLLGIDYSQPAIDLARKVAAADDLSIDYQVGLFSC